MTESADDSDLRVPLVIGAVGHRDLVEGEVAGLDGRVRDFLETLQRKYPHLRVTVLTSVADGADRLVADVASSLGMTITYVLPMPSDLFERDFDAESLRQYRRILGGSNVLTLPLVNGNTANDVTHPGAARDMQYAQLGAFIAAHCHILLALWDGNEDGPPGGTAAIVRFHQDDYMPGHSDGEPRSRLDDTDDESDLVYHVVCSRDRADGGPIAPLRIGETWWLSRNERMPRTLEMPQRYEIVLHRMSEFSEDVQRRRQAIEATPNVLLAANDVGLSAGDRAIAQMFAAADYLAIFYGRLRLTALRLVCGFALAALLSFLLYNDLPGFEQMIYPYLGFMAMSIAVWWIADRADWQRRYLDYRVLAEALRVQFYWAIAGVERPKLSRFGHDVFLKRHDLELGWIRNILRVSGLRADAAASRPTEAGIAIAVRDWVGDETSGQWGYYRRGWAEKRRDHSITEMLGHASLGAGLVLAAWLAVAQGWFGREPSAELIALMGLLPLFAAIREVYAHRRAEHELINQFQFMDRILSNARRQLARAASSSERCRILFELGDAAMREHGQWIMRLRERPISTVS
jgi:hypothetical protein